MLITAAKINANDQELFLLLGRLGEIQGELEKAFKFYYKAFHQRPYSKSIITPLFRTGSRIGEWKELNLIFTALSQYHPDNMEIAANLAFINKNLGELQFSESQGVLRQTGPSSEEAKDSPFVRETEKISRNAQCPCGSGKKYKNCCLKKEGKIVEKIKLSKDHKAVFYDRPSREVKIARLLEKDEIRIKVTSAADRVSLEKARRRWGDYWVKYELEKEFTNLGLVIDNDSPDVVVHLFGEPPDYLQNDAYNIVWLHSHPDMVTADNLRGFDRIFCLSPQFSEKLEAMDYEHVEVMLAATPKRPYKSNIIYDVVFAGNSRGKYGRPIINALGHPPYRLKIWGAGWEKIMPPIYLGGKYFDFEHVERLYASAAISLNDHHEDMAREGFSTFRLYDILAGGGFAVSDKCLGLDELFNGAVPQYESEEHLRELIEKYLHDFDERERLRKIGQEIALKNTFADRAGQMVKDFFVSHALETMADSLGDSLSVSLNDLSF